LTEIFLTNDKQRSTTNIFIFCKLLAGFVIHWNQKSCKNGREN